MGTAFEATSKFLPSAPITSEKTAIMTELEGEISVVLMISLLKKISTL